MIVTAEKLADFVSELAGAPWVALDTEADSMHAYPEKLCLIQISIPGHDVLIDPLAGVDLQPLWQALGAHELIFHAADYDLRLLRRVGFVPSRIFDTMLASRLNGATRFGLADVVQQFLGLTLEKGPQKADWSRRPLTERMEEYARNDTKHLKVVSDRLREELAAKGRLEWLLEWCARWLSECSAEVIVDQNLVWRIKGSSKLSRRGLAALRELWQWRETEAIASNRPPFFILNHDTLVALAGVVSEGGQTEPLIPRHLTPRRRSGLQAALERAQAIPSEQWPEVLRHFSQRPTGREIARAEMLQKKRDEIATNLAIDPTLLATRSMLFELAKDESSARASLMRWQDELLFGAAVVQPV